MSKRTDYDIGKAFERIENEIFDSMIRNLEHHRIMESVDGFDYAQWQALQLKSLERFRKFNKKKCGLYFDDINDSLEYAIEQAYQIGGFDEEIDILNQIIRSTKGAPKGKLRTIYRKLARKHISSKGKKIEYDNSFFLLNTPKMEALQKATKADMQKAEQAMLRRSNDQYRKIIYDSQMAHASGAYSYNQAVDMATRDFLRSGINCIEYSDGKRVNIADYSRMVLRTANKRAALTAQGAVRDELNLHLVRLNANGQACPKCMRWRNTILIDDVYSGGSKADGDYPLLSEAMAQGLFHPNCRDSLSTYIPGVSRDNAPVTSADQKKALAQYNAEQKVQMSERQAKKYKRLAKFSLDEDNKKKYLKIAQGLSANDDSYNMIPKHKAPEIIKTIDFNDKKAVKSTLQEFETSAVNEKNETACVIAQDGTVYKCYGVEDRVFIDSDIGEVLIGAKVSHNHPISVTEYSFSGDDFELFNKYELDILRGVDQKYTYELSRTSKVIDEHVSIFEITEENAAHEMTITRAEEYNVGYRRWLND